MLLLAFTTLSPSHAAPCRVAPLVRAEALGSEPLDEDCATLDLDIGGRGFLELPEAGISRGVALQRFRAEIGLRARSDVQTRVAFLHARSGGDDGYIGIDGESMVPVLQIAEARWDWRATGLAFAGGVVDDVWVMTIQPTWARIELQRPLSTDQGWMPRADVGGFASWTAPEGVASVTASVTTGEGFKRRERNNGTNLTGVLHLRPLALTDAPLDVEIALMARDGSVGIAQAPDHRAGAAVMVRHDYVVGGVDGLLGWGLGGDGELAPGGVSAWARTGPAVPAVGVARVDLATDARGVPESGETLMMLAAGPQLPFRREGGPAYVVVGWEGRRFGAASTPVAGSGAAAASDLLFIQLGGRLLGSLPLHLR